MFPTMQEQSKVKDLPKTKDYNKIKNPFCITNMPQFVFKVFSRLNKSECDKEETKLGCPGTPVDISQVG